MKVFCALLLVGLFVYCKGAGHQHECDFLAVNLAITDEQVKEGDNHRTGRDKNNQYVKVETYLDGVNGTRWIARATGLDKGADFEICTTVTHGSGCGSIMYENKLLKKPDPNPKTDNYKDVVLENNVIIQTNTYSLHLKSGTMFAIAMKAKLINRDDLIFKADEFVGYQLLDNNTKLAKIDINDEIWPTYQNLIAKMSQEFAVSSVEDGFSTSITCDEKLAWAAYKDDLVKKQLEGSVAIEMDKALFHLDTDHHEDAIKNPFDINKVKPISTVLPTKGLELLKGAMKDVNFRL